MEDERFLCHENPRFVFGGSSFAAGRGRGTPGRVESAPEDRVRGNAREDLQPPPAARDFGCLEGSP